MRTIVLCALVAVTALSQATILLTDNFDTEHGGVSQSNYNAFANWVVSDGSVDIIANGAFGLQGSGMFVDLDGSSNNAGKMTTRTSFNLVAGLQYTLTFSLSGNQRFGQTDIVQVALGAAYAESFSDPAHQFWHTITRTITPSANESATLSFEHSGADNVGMLLDNVILEVVPEPATVLTLGAAISAILTRRRRR